MAYSEKTKKIEDLQQKRIRNLKEGFNFMAFMAILGWTILLFTILLL